MLKGERMGKEAILGVWPALGGWDVRTTVRVRRVPAEKMDGWADEVHAEPDRMAGANCYLIVDEAGVVAGLERE